jgi:hypothetical protein
MHRDDAGEVLMRGFLSLLIVVGLALTGCSLVVGGEIDDLSTDINAKRDVTIQLRGFDPHVGQAVDIRIVRPVAPGEMGTPQILARAIIDPMPGDCVDVNMQRAAPLVANRVDFYADINGNGIVDPTPTDHSWRFDLDEDGTLLFVHDVVFTNIETDMPASPGGNDLVVNVTGADAHDGRQVVAALITSELVDPETGDREDSIPGVYVLGAVEAGTIAFTLPGVVDSGRTYELELAIGDGAARCSITEDSPAGGEFTIAADLADFECDTADPRGVFEDCSR